MKRKKKLKISPIPFEGFTKAMEELEVHKEMLQERKDAEVVGEDEEEDEEETSHHDTQTEKHRKSKVSSHHDTQTEK